jgi:hypothetical protein
MNLLYHNIPDELKNLRQWVLYRLQWKTLKATGERKKNKVPFSVKGYKAASTKPEDWCTFAQAAAAPVNHKVYGETEDVAKGDGYAGIGFVFTTASGYVGIDFDGVRNPETGEIEQWAVDVATELNSYTEISQSGTGFHIIAKGKMPEGGNRRKRVEMYYHGRFFVMTGKSEFGLGDCTSINRCDLTSVHKRMLDGTIDPRPEPKIVEQPTVLDESSEDAKLITKLYHKLEEPTPELLEAAFKVEYPERWATRNKEKGDRAGKTFLRYSIDRMFPSLDKDKAQSKIDLPPDAEIHDTVWPEFPQECVIGPLRSIFDSYAFIPPQLLFMSLVTGFGSMAGRRLRLAVRPPFRVDGRLYSIMIAHPGGWKGSATAISNALLTGVDPYGSYADANVAADEEDSDSESIVSENLATTLKLADGIGSGEGLVTFLQENGSHSCLVFDEISSFLKKGAIERSTLFEKVTTAFDATELSVHVARSKERKPLVVKNIWLSILGGTTFDSWNSNVGPISGGGAFSRFMFAVSDKIKRARGADVDVDFLAVGNELRQNLDRIRSSDDAPKQTEAGMQVIEDWAATVPLEALYQRLEVITKRVALVLAAMCGTDITPEVAGAAVAWGKYQAQLRGLLSPVDVENKDAACEQAMLRHLPKAGKVRWTWLYEKANLRRYGSVVARRVRDAMVANSVLCYDRQPAGQYVWLPVPPHTQQIT